MRALGLAVAVLVATACASPRLGPAATLVGCPMAEVEGILVAIPPEHMSLLTDEGDGVEVDWSDAISIRMGDSIELVDTRSGVVARAGDRVVITGGALRGRGTWTECGGVRVLPTAS